MRYKELQKGFTLIELMVSLTLFVIVVLAAVSSLYSVNNASRKVSAMRNVLDNLNFALESMSRTVRTGSVPVCGGRYAVGSSTHNCRFGIDSPSTLLMVHSTLGKERDLEFRLGTNSNGGGEIEKCVNDSGIWQACVALTSPEINVQTLSFYVDGADANDSIQPNIIMFVQGVATVSADSVA